MEETKGLYIVATDRNGDEYFTKVKNLTTDQAINQAFGVWCSLVPYDKKYQVIEVREYKGVDGYNTLITFSMENYLSCLELLINDTYDCKKIELEAITFYNGKYLKADQDIDTDKIYYKLGLDYEYVTEDELTFIENLDIFKRGVYDN